MQRFIRMRARSALVMAALAVAVTIGLASAFASVSASASKSIAIDANGDVTSGVSTQDITKATVEKADGVFEFTLKMAESIPSPIPSDHQWIFVLDSEPGGVGADPDDYIIGVQAHPVTGEYVGFVSYLPPGPPFTRITFVPFEIKGKDIKISVDAGLIGDPSSLKWYALTRPANFPAPSTDEVPNGATNGTIEWHEDQVNVWTGNE